MSRNKNSNFNDLTGRKFGRWTVVGYAGFDKRHFWEVTCECGNIRKVQAYELISARSKSCGCLTREVNRDRRTVHGEFPAGKASPEMRGYLLAKAQCENPAHENYEKFGARGVKFLFANFEDFLRAVGRKPGPKYVLTRRDRGGNYESGNVVWTTNKNRQQKRIK